MSQIIEIHTKNEIDINDLYKFIVSRSENIKGIEKAENGFYFYQDMTSTRGIDFWKEDYGYEVKLTVLSNSADKEIAKYILVYFLSFVRDAHYIIDGTKINNDEIIDEIIINNFHDEAQTIKKLIEHNYDCLTFFGANTEFYLGQKAMRQIESTKDGWEDRLEQFIQYLLYHLPQYGNDTIMELKNEKHNKIVKLVNPETDYILKKYDYLLFNKVQDTKSLEDMLLITNDILNNHLPQKWRLVDDYTIIATALSKNEYNKLVNDLTAFDCSAELHQLD